MISINSIGHGIDINELSSVESDVFYPSLRSAIPCISGRKRSASVGPSDEIGGVKELIKPSRILSRRAPWLKILTGPTRLTTPRRVQESRSNSRQSNHSIACATLSVIQYISILIELLVPPFMCTFSPKYPLRNFHLSKSKQRIQSMRTNTIPCRRKRHLCISLVNTILQRSLQ